MLGVVLIVSVGMVMAPALLTCAAEGQTSPAGAGSTDPNANPSAAGDLPVPTTGKVIKTEKEWLKQLTRAQFMVTRMKATEPAFSGKYVNNHAIGTYACVCCGAPLFNSRAKFESGTGWPSFWAPYSPERIAQAPDYHGPEPRVEVMCSKCDAHLGHVFSDGPPPTGLRFCINSTSLKFLPEARAKAKTKAKTAPKADTAAEAAPATDPANPTPPAADPAPSEKPAP
jgi:peptide-methionine (R)-S-oxide reductase